MISDSNPRKDGAIPPGQVHADGKRILAPKEVSKIMAHKIEKTDEVPKDFDQVVALGTEFVHDIGVVPGADVHRRSKKVSETVLLRRQIAELRDDIFDELKELKKRSEKYAHVAENAGHWVNDARHFVDKHPNLLWFLSKRKTGTR